MLSQLNSGESKKLPTCHFIWIGPPSGKEGGQDLNWFEGFYLYAENPIVFVCLEKYEEYYEELFKNEEVKNVQIKTVESLIEQCVDSKEKSSSGKSLCNAHNEILDVYTKTLERADSGSNSKRLYDVLKNLVSLLIIYREGGYSLNSNIGILKDEFFSLQAYPDFMGPILVSDTLASFLLANKEGQLKAQYEFFMCFAPKSNKKTLDGIMSFLKEWKQAEEMYQKDGDTPAWRVNLDRLIHLLEVQKDAIKTYKIPENYPWLCKLGKNDVSMPNLNLQVTLGSVEGDNKVKNPFFKTNLQEVKNTKQVLEKLNLPKSSNTISIIKKNPKGKKVGGSLHDEKIYIMKTLKDEKNRLEELSRECLAQELNRLICGSLQPKTRLGGWQGKLVLLSETKEIILLHDVKKDKFISGVLNGKIIGLGSATVFSVFICDTDRHLKNIGLIEIGNNEWALINIDQGHSFKDTKQKQLELTKKLIENLPMIDETTYKTSNWYNLIQWAKDYPGNVMRKEDASYVTDDMQKKDSIIHEKNLTILKLLLLSDEIINKFVASYTDDSSLKKFFSDWLVNQRKALLESVICLDQFSNYLNKNDTEQKDLEGIIQEFKSFRTMRKNNLYQDSDFEAIRKTYGNIRKEMILAKNKEIFNKLLEKVNSPLEEVKEKDVGIAKDEKAAVQNELGKMYLKGTGVKKDKKEAVRLFRLAAEQGHAGGQNNLGLMYEKGCGVEKNLENAIYWYDLAAAQECVTAQKSLENLRKQDIEFVYITPKSK